MIGGVFIKIYCEHCCNYTKPIKVNKNILSLKVICNNCKKDLNIFRNKKVERLQSITQAFIVGVLCVIKPYMLDMKKFILLVMVTEIAFVVIIHLILSIIVFRLKNVVQDKKQE